MERSVMHLGVLQKVMIENGLAIRAIPTTSKTVVEIRNKDRFPNGHAQYIEEYKREMWVDERKNNHGGQFVVECNCGTDKTVHFSGKRFYNSIEELIMDFKG